jgi:hypothetical protein
MAGNALLFQQRLDLLVVGFGIGGQTNLGKREVRQANQEPSEGGQIPMHRHGPWYPGDGNLAS